MKHVWTWGGTYFGYINGDMLFTHHGAQAGRIDGDDIYGSDGRYLGEIRNDNRLITNLSKQSYAGGGFLPAMGGAVAQYANYVGYAMYAGYEDFPAPETF